jgi:hypothetical protein
MKKLLLALTLLSGMAQANVHCSGSGYDVSVQGNSMQVSGPHSFTANVKKTVRFSEVYKGVVRQSGVDAVKLDRQGGSSLLTLETGSGPRYINVSCN